MDAREAARLTRERRRWLRPDWQRWLRPDWERYVTPAHREAMRQEFAERKMAFETAPCARQWMHDEQIAREREQALETARAWEADCAERKFKADVAWLRFKRALAGLLNQKAGYDPTQRRNPAGNGIESGRWAAEGDNPVRLAGLEKLPPFRALRLAYQVTKRLIDAYRSENILYDFLEKKKGSVSVTTIDGKDIFGTNRGSQLWDRSDERDWQRLRDSLTEKYPELRQENQGELPLNALTHSETNVIVRTARQYGGNLAGRHIEVFTDKPMCSSCPTVLPYVTREFGSPTVTYTYLGPKGPGKGRTIENGEWK